VGRFAFICLGSSVLFSALIARAQPPAAAATTSGTPPTSEAPAAAAKASSDPVICRWEEEIGSRLGNHKVCLTKSQWQQESFDSQDQINDTTRRADQTSPPGH
jgi:hypothetical protein